LPHTKKASPMIQEGAPAPVLASKNAPMHSVELVCVKAKSAGLIDHVAPPNDSSTFTVVEHADGTLSQLTSRCSRSLLTEAIISCPFTRGWL
jgi:hypothetical protein